MSENVPSLTRLVGVRINEQGAGSTRSGPARRGVPLILGGVQMKLRIILAALMGAVSLGAGAGVARADQISFMDTVPLQPTNFNSSVTIPKFDPNLGVLTKVIFKLDGHVEGTAKFESLDSEPAVIDMELAAQITLQRPDMSTLVVSLPLVMTSDNATAFDGLVDFDGTSGKTYAGLMADDLEMAMTMDPGDLALFTGVGDISLPVLAMGASTGSGAGNLLLQFNTSASAGVMVTYCYIPEPATVALCGVGALGFIRRRRWTTAR